LVIIVKIIKKYSTKPTSFITMLHWKTNHEHWNFCMEPLIVRQESTLVDNK
jgi:hypothetical protein